MLLMWQKIPGSPYACATSVFVFQSRGALVGSHFVTILVSVTVPGPVLGCVWWCGWYLCVHDSFSEAPSCCHIPWMEWIWSEMKQFSLVLSLRVPPSEKQSGERSQISWAYSPKSELWIITSHFPYNSKICSSLFKYLYLSFWTLLGYTVARACASPRNSTWFTRPFLSSWSRIS